MGKDFIKYHEAMLNVGWRSVPLMVQKVGLGQALDVEASKRGSSRRLEETVSTIQPNFRIQMNKIDRSESTGPYCRLEYFMYIISCVNVLAKQAAGDLGIWPCTSIQARTLTA